MTDQKPKDDSISYFAIPFVTITFLSALGAIFLIFGMMLDIADWVPPVEWDGMVYRGAHAITSVYAKIYVRGALIAWPILTVAFIFVEREDRKAKASVSEA